MYMHVHACRCINARTADTYTVYTSIAWPLNNIILTPSGSLVLLNLPNYNPQHKEGEK